MLISTFHFMNKFNFIKAITSTIYKKDRDFLKSWLMQMSVYFVMHANQFSSEAFKVLFATSYMKEAIFDWMQSRVKDYFKNSKLKRKIETFQIFYNFINLIIVIKKAFENKDENKVNEKKLLILRQQKTMTIYVAQFKTLIYKTNWDDSTLKIHFYKELNDRVKNVMIAIKESNSLIEIIKLTQQELTSNNTSDISTNKRISKQNSLKDNSKKIQWNSMSSRQKNRELKFVTHAKKQNI